MANISFNIESYTDPNSGLHGEVVSVFINNRKIYERDYGSQTQNLKAYYEDYILFISTGIQEC